MEPELKAVLGEAPKVTRVVTGFASASGPVFSRRGYLLFCDAAAAKILKWEDGAMTVFREAGNGARALTFDHQGRLLACEKNRVTRIEKNGTITVLSPAREPSDVVYAIDGSIYFSDAAGVHMLKRGGGAGTLSRDCERASSVALSPTQQVLYVVGSGRVCAFAIRSSGSLEKPSVFADVSARGLTGLKTDEDGRVWVAAGAEGVLVFSREGKRLGNVDVPEPVSGLTWGEGFRNLFVTTPSSIYRIEARANGTRTF